MKPLKILLKYIFNHGGLENLSGKKIIWFKIHVKLREGAYVIDNKGEQAPDSAKAYYWCLGLLSDSQEDARKEVLNNVDDGTIEWDESDVYEITMTEINADKIFRKSFRKNRDKKIWYTSGKIFHG